MNFAHRFARRLSARKALTASLTTALVAAGLTALAPAAQAGPPTTSQGWDMTLSKVITAAVTSTAALDDNPFYSIVQTSPTEAGTQVAAGHVSLSGTPYAFSPVTADVDSWPATAALHYQWAVDGTPVGDGTDSYTPNADDEGKSLSVSVYATQDYYEDSDPVSSSSLTIETPQLTTGTVTLDVPTVGWTITADAEDWPAGAQLHYAWQLDGTPVGTDSATYWPTADDLGADLTVTVHASEDGYMDSDDVSSDPAEVVLMQLDVGLVVFDRLPRVGEPVRAVTDSWPFGADLTYEWQLNGVPLSDDTDAYTPTAADEGKTLTVSVWADKPGYATSETDSVSHTVGAAAIRPVDTVKPKIVAQVHGAKSGSWWRGPVTVRFICAAGSAAVVSCPKPVTINSGKARHVTGKALAADGGSASVTVTVNVDGSGPRLIVRGATSGRKYQTAPKVTCSASDAEAGVSGHCSVTRKIGKANALTGSQITWTIKAQDKVGNRTSKSITARLAPAVQLGAQLSRGRYKVAKGRTYTLTVHAKSRPQLLYADPATPHVPGQHFIKSKSGVWTLQFPITCATTYTRPWKLGVKIGSKVTVLPLYVTG